jgi:hypothetical protein
MEAVAAMLGIWFLHLAVAGVLSAPVIHFGRHRVHWGICDLLALVLPFLLWAHLMLLSGAGKTLANLAEYVVIAIAIAVALLVRVVIGHHKHEKLWAGCLLLGLCGVAMATYFLMPPLPE